MVPENKKKSNCATVSIKHVCHQKSSKMCIGIHQMQPFFLLHSPQTQAPLNWIPRYSA